MKRLATVMTLALMVGVLTLAISGVADATKQKVDYAKGKGEFVTEPALGLILTQKVTIQPVG